MSTNQQLLDESLAILAMLDKYDADMEAADLISDNICNCMDDEEDEEDFDESAEEMGLFDIPALPEEAEDFAALFDASWDEEQ